MEQSLATRIEREVERQADLGIVVEDDDGVLVLSGLVDSVEARQAAEDIAQRLAPDRRIDNNLDIPDQTTDTAADLTSAEPTFGALPTNVDEIREMGDDIEPDFPGQSVLSDPVEVGGPSSESDDPGSAGGEVYSPPTDPVITSNERGETEVLGGFSPTSTDEVEVEPSASDNRPGDEALEDAIRRELRQDASTTDLEIRVVVRNGVAHLRGTVPGLEDADNAEAVTSSVPGVTEVIEELEVAEL